MKIFDCFMYFDEDLVLDIRLNTLDKYVDFFVILNATKVSIRENIPTTKIVRDIGI